jgi:hypothetical protein
MFATRAYARWQSRYREANHVFHSRDDRLRDARGCRYDEHDQRRSSPEYSHRGWIGDARSSRADTPALCPFPPGSGLGRTLKIREGVPITNIAVPPLGSETNHAEECDRYDRILCGVAVTLLNAL